MKEKKVYKLMLIGKKIALMSKDKKICQKIKKRANY